MRLPSLLLAALVSSAGLFAQAIDVNIPYEKFTLSNGLTVIVHEDHKAPIVAVNLWYHVGSKNEKRGKTGFAHLFEHLMFNGSEHFNTDYFKVLEKIGATDLNGTTDQDRTNFFQNVPTSALDTVLWMESDRMGYLVGVVDKARLDEQRGVVQNEKRQGENEPYGMIDELIQTNTYPAAHPYSWTVIGSMEDLNAASLDDVKEWFKTYYGPSNAVIVLAGDIDAKTAREKVEKYFGAIPPGPPVPHQRAWIAKMEGTHRQVAEDRVPQARIFHIWNTPPDFTEDQSLLTIAGQILGAGRTSRLYRRLVYKDQLATSATATASPSEIGSQFYMDVTVKPGGDPAQVEKAMDEELAALLRDGPTPEELERAKTRYVATFLRGAERIGGFGGKSDLLARSQVYAGDPGAYRKTLQTIQTATAAQVRDAARRWLSDGVYILTVVPFPDYKPETTTVDRTKVPEPGTPPTLRLPTVHERTLSNGLKVKLAERHEVPLVTISTMFDAGWSADTAAGTAKLTMAMLDQGTPTRTAPQISEQLEVLGATLNKTSNADACTLTMSALKTNLDKSLDLYADVLLHPTFPAADFDREKRLQLAAIQREKTQPTSMAFRVIPGLLFGKGHPYGNPFTGSGTEASVGSITRDNLLRYHQTWFKPNNATLIVAGDTTLDEIVPKLEKLLAAWKGGEVPKKAIPTAQQPDKVSVYLIDKPGAQQSFIMAAQLAPARNNPDEIPLELYDYAMGGAFVSRINMNLREDKHWSYGSGTSMIGTAGQRGYFAYAPVQTDKTKESMVEVSKEFHDVLGSKPITADELAVAKDGLTLALPGSRETINSVANSIAEIVRDKLPADWWETYSARIRAVTPQQVSTAVERFLKPDHMVWVVVGDRAKIEAGVRELNFGELKVVDGDGNPAK